MVALMIAIVLPTVFSGCRSVRGQWGIEGEYGLSVDGHNHYYESKDDKHKKPKKHKKKHRHHEATLYDESLEIPV